MKIITSSLKQKLILILLGTIAFNPTLATSNTEITEDIQAVKPQQPKNHLKHPQDLIEKQQYHGVFYGFFPCKNCDGTKTTLSLKNRNNYLIVTQSIKASSREYFEKGKYTWDDNAKIVTLISRKDSTIRKYRINDEKTLTQLSSKGLPLVTKQKNTSYVLHKKDQVQRNATMHMH